jgi:hypothetical protein
MLMPKFGGNGILPWGSVRSMLIVVYGLPVCRLGLFRTGME